MDYRYQRKHTFTHNGNSVSLWLYDAPPVRPEKPLVRRWGVQTEFGARHIGYAESPREGVWVARNRLEAQGGDTVRWYQAATMDDALRRLLRWYEEDLHSAEGPADEPDPLAPAGGQVIPDPGIAIAPVPAGIPLRDWFAGMALAGGLEQGACDNMMGDWWHDPAHVAQRAYAMADALMRERDRTTQNKSSQGG